MLPLSDILTAHYPGVLFVKCSVQWCIWCVLSGMLEKTTAGGQQSQLFRKLEQIALETHCRSFWEHYKLWMHCKREQYLAKLLPTRASTREKLMFVGALKVWMS